MKKIEIKNKENQKLITVDIRIDEQFFLKQYAQNIDKILQIIKKEIFLETCEKEIKKYETQE